MLLVNVTTFAAFAVVTCTVPLSPPAIGWLELEIATLRCPVVVPKFVLAVVVIPRSSMS